MQITKGQFSGINFQETQNTLGVYPNPAASFVNFTVEFENENVTVSIYAESGTFVKSITGNVGFDSRITVDTGSLLPGNYIAVITTSKNNYSTNFIIQ